MREDSAGLSGQRCFVIAPRLSKDNGLAVCVKLDA
jgi:hypothetical protein